MNSVVETRFVFRRIVVAMDSSAHARAAAEAAAGLAARFEAVLEGLYVEDIDLINLGGHPAGRLVSYPSGTAGGLNAQDLERQIRNECQSARRALEAVATRRGLRSSFKVLRGRIDAEILAAASEADLLVLGVAGRGVLTRRRAGSVALAAAERAQRSVLVYRSRVPPRGSPLVCFDGSETSAKALEAAISLPREHHDEIRVALMPSEACTRKELRERASQLLGDRGLKAILLELTPPTPERLCEFAALADTNAIVVGAGASLFQGDGLRTLLGNSPCPLLLVR